MKRFWCWLWGHKWTNWLPWQLQIRDSSEDCKMISRRWCLRHCGHNETLRANLDVAETWTPAEIATGLCEPLSKEELREVDRKRQKIEEERG